MKKNVILIFILFTALAVRLWGINFGLPNFFFHTDEHRYIHAAHQLVQTGNYPQTGSPEEEAGLLMNIPFINMLAILIRAIFKGERGLKALNLIEGSREMTIDQVYLYLRALSAAISTLTVLITYKIGAKLYGWRVGLLSAVVLTITFLDVQTAHYVKQDVYLGLISAAILLISFQLLLKGRLISYLALGFLGGLAAALKLNGIGLMAGLLSAHLIRNWEEIKQKPLKLLNFKIILAAAAAVGSFLLAHPETPLNVIKGLPALLNTPFKFTQTVVSDANGIPTPIWWVVYLATSGLFYPLFVAAVGGIFIALKKHGKKELLLLSFPIFYFVTISVPSRRFDRWATPLTPYLAIFSALLLFQIFQNLRVKKERSKSLRVVLISLTVGTFILIPAGRILAFDYLISKKDTRETAVEWVKENLDQSSLTFLLGTTNLKKRLKAGGFEG